MHNVCANPQGLSAKSGKGVLTSPSNPEKKVEDGGSGKGKKCVCVHVAYFHLMCVYLCMHVYIWRTEVAVIHLNLPGLLL